MNTTPEQLRLADELPDLCTLLECFDYNRSTGDLIWKERPAHHFPSLHRMRIWNASHAGKTAGVKSHRKSGGPHAILVRLTQVREKYNLRAHRVILALCGTVIPRGMVVDHIDGNAFNNRLENLRLATVQQNAWNAPLGRAGKYPCGVHKRGNSFRATIAVGSKKILLGTFKTPEAAGAAYAKKAAELRGQFIRKSA